MSTFLTQGISGIKSSSAKNNDAQQIQSQMQNAPFVKSTDKVKRDTVEMSFSDFQPKRFALNYDPPVIVLEYLVPSTGKLYHRKMKLRQLKSDSDTNEMIDYLKKRHPLYFIANKIKPKQIENLINKMKYKLKQNEEKAASKDNGKKGTDAKVAVSSSNVLKKENKEPVKEDNKYSFPSFDKPQSNSSSVLMAGGALPSLADNSKGQQNSSKNAVAKFDDLQLNDYEDEFGEDDEDDEGDFDANELLDFTDYQNKRLQKINAQEQPKQESIVKQLTKASAKVEDNNDWGDDWGFDDAKKANENLNNFDYNNTDLNKMSDTQLEQHKKNMDVKFQQNSLKPGDAGFEYDKRVDFASKKKLETSWDEDVDEYFDDDFN